MLNKHPYTLNTNNLNEINARKPQIVIASCHCVDCRDRDPSSESCVVHFFKVSTKLRKDLRGKEFTVREVGSTEESDMRGYTVYRKRGTQY